MWYINVVLHPLKKKKLHLNIIQAVAMCAITTYLENNLLICNQNCEEAGLVL